MIFDCERFAALRDSPVSPVFTPGARHFAPSARSALNSAQGSVRRFMESDYTHSVLHFISRCMDILDAETHTHIEGHASCAHADQSGRLKAM
jgi:hypothetical protein